MEGSDFFGSVYGVGECDAGSVGDHCSLLCCGVVFACVSSVVLLWGSGNGGCG